MGRDLGGPRNTVNYPVWANISHTGVFPHENLMNKFRQHLMTQDFSQKTIYGLGAVLDASHPEEKIKEALADCIIGYSREGQELARVSLGIEGVANTDIDQVHWYMLESPVAFKDIAAWNIPVAVCDLMLLLGPGAALAIAVAPDFNIPQA